MAPPGSVISDPEVLADWFEERAAFLEADCELDPPAWIGAQIPYTRRQAQRQAVDEARERCVPELAQRIRRLQVVASDPARIVAVILERARRSTSRRS
jgi:hypothetical protein